jgi:GDP-4-dehydro-6-deoxy-D-mannose reductase
MRILITGLTGFVGGHLAEVLAAGDAELFGLCRRPGWPADLAHLEKRVRLQVCDLCDEVALQGVLGDVAPDQIFHLAGYTNAGQSFRHAEAAWQGNLAATRGLYAAIERWGGRPRILYVGSGLVYEVPDDVEHAHDEHCPLLPTSPYAASKSAADLLSYQCSRHPGLDIIRARPFNHIGPRQSADFAIAHFAKQIAAMERNLQPPTLHTGNLAPRRDVTDVRDVVRAYLLLMERGKAGEVYNVASGQAPSIDELLARLLTHTNTPVQTRQQPDLVRAADIPVVRGNSAKLRKQTDWRPLIPIQQTLADTLEYWRRVL